ncbi:hypothetical protein Bbelb_409860 [Branchiostoma belcheri]|nr:hypothetical protein Bbelb_409860 [Branchiostoma belcheri]
MATMLKHLQTMEASGSQSKEVCKFSMMIDSLLETNIKLKTKNKELQERNKELLGRNEKLQAENEQLKKNPGKCRTGSSPVEEEERDKSEAEGSERKGIESAVVPCTLSAVEEPDTQPAELCETGAQLQEDLPHEDMTQRDGAIQAVPGSPPGDPQQAQVCEDDATSGEVQEGDKVDKQPTTDSCSEDHDYDIEGQSSETPHNSRTMPNNENNDTNCQGNSNLTKDRSTCDSIEPGTTERSAFQVVYDMMRELSMQAVSGRSQGTGGLSDSKNLSVDDSGGTGDSAKPVRDNVVIVTNTTGSMSAMEDSRGRSNEVENDTNGCRRSTSRSSSTDRNTASPALLQEVTPVQEEYADAIRELSPISNHQPIVKLPQSGCHSTPELSDDTVLYSPETVVDLTEENKPEHPPKPRRLNRRRRKTRRRGRKPAMKEMSITNGSMSSKEVIQYLQTYRAEENRDCSGESPTERGGGSPLGIIDTESALRAVMVISDSCISGGTIDSQAENKGTGPVEELVQNAATSVVINSQEDMQHSEQEDVETSSEASPVTVTPQKSRGRGRSPGKRAKGRSPHGENKESSFLPPKIISDDTDIETEPVSTAPQKRCGRGRPPGKRTPKDGGPGVCTDFSDTCGHKQEPEVYDTDKEVSVSAVMPQKHRRGRPPGKRTLPKDIITFHDSSPYEESNVPSILVSYRRLRPRSKEKNQSSISGRLRSGSRERLRESRILLYNSEDDEQEVIKDSALGEDSQNSVTWMSQEMSTVIYSATSQQDETSATWECHVEDSKEQQQQLTKARPGNTEGVSHGHSHSSATQEVVVGNVTGGTLQSVDSGTEPMDSALEQGEFRTKAQVPSDNTGETSSLGIIDTESALRAVKSVMVISDSWEATDSQTENKRTDPVEELVQKAATSEVVDSQEERQHSEQEDVRTNAVCQTSRDTHMEVTPTPPRKRRGRPPGKKKSPKDVLFRDRSPHEGNVTGGTVQSVNSGTEPINSGHEQEDFRTKVPSDSTSPKPNNDQVLHEGPEELSLLVKDSSNTTSNITTRDQEVLKKFPGMLEKSPVVMIKRLEMTSTTAYVCETEQSGHKESHSNVQDLLDSEVKTSSPSMQESAQVPPLSCPTPDSSDESEPIWEEKLCHRAKTRKVGSKNRNDFPSCDGMTRAWTKAEVIKQVREHSLRERSPLHDGDKEVHQQTKCHIDLESALTAVTIIQKPPLPPGEDAETEKEGENQKNLGMVPGSLKIRVRLYSTTAEQACSKAATANEQSSTRRRVPTDTGAVAEHSTGSSFKDQTVHSKAGRTKETDVPCTNRKVKKLKVHFESIPQTTEDTSKPCQKPSTTGTNMKGPDSSKEENGKTLGHAPQHPTIENGKNKDFGAALMQADCAVLEPTRQVGKYARSQPMKKKGAKEIHTSPGKVVGKCTQVVRTGKGQDGRKTTNLQKQSKKPGNSTHDQMQGTDVVSLTGIDSESGRNSGPALSGGCDTSRTAEKQWWSPSSQQRSPTADGVFWSPGAGDVGADDLGAEVEVPFSPVKAQRGKNPSTSQTPQDGQLNTADTGGQSAQPCKKGGSTRKRPIRRKLNTTGKKGQNKSQTKTSMKGKSNVAVKGKDSPTNTTPLLSSNSSKQPSLKESGMQGEPPNNTPQFTEAGQKVEVVFTSVQSPAMPVSLHGDSPLSPWKQRPPVLFSSTSMPRMAPLTTEKTPQQSHCGKQKTGKDTQAKEKQPTNKTVRDRMESQTDATTSQDQDIISAALQEAAADQVPDTVSGNKDAMNALNCTSLRKTGDSVRPRGSQQSNNMSFHMQLTPQMKVVGSSGPSPDSGNGSSPALTQLAEQCYPDPLLTMGCNKVMLENSMRGHHNDLQDFVDDSPVVNMHASLPAVSQEPQLNTTVPPASLPFLTFRSEQAVFTNMPLDTASTLPQSVFNSMPLDTVTSLPDISFTLGSLSTEKTLGAYDDVRGKETSMQEPSGNLKGQKESVKTRKKQPSFDNGQVGISDTVSNIMPFGNDTCTATDSSICDIEVPVVSDKSCRDTQQKKTPPLGKIAKVAQRVPTSPELTIKRRRTKRKLLDSPPKQKPTAPEKFSPTPVLIDGKEKIPISRLPSGRNTYSYKAVLAGQPVQGTTTGNIGNLLVLANASDLVERLCSPVKVDVNRNNCQPMLHEKQVTEVNKSICELSAEKRPSEGSGNPQAQVLMAANTATPGDEREKTKDILEEAMLQITGDFSFPSPRETEANASSKEDGILKNKAGLRIEPDPFNLTVEELVTLPKPTHNVRKTATVTQPAAAAATSASSTSSTLAGSNKPADKNPLLNVAASTKPVVDSMPADNSSPLLITSNSSEMDNPLSIVATDTSCPLSSVTACTSPLRSETGEDDFVGRCPPGPPIRTSSRL